ncbi:MAG: DUF5329 domain-containing protein [Desulfobacterales bacterium]|nr:DUF5329 domain-containing protein [Desulfobacterales bacterium]
MPAYEGVDPDDHPNGACLIGLFGCFEGGGSPPAAEKQIEALIAAIERMTDAAFIRNGRPYGAAAAAEFLRRKWRHRAADVGSADDFIEKVASFSSTTGQPYRIRFSDGRETPCATFLRTELSNLRQKEQ